MWFWWALASALISGIGVTFCKRVLNTGVHSSVVALFLFAFITVISLPLLLTQGVNSKVDLTFYIATGISALVYSYAKTIQLTVFKHNNLSDIYPLTALAPVSLYILSVIFLSEVVKPLAVLGILAMAAGVYLINYRRSNNNIFQPVLNFFSSKYSKMYLLAIILSSISAVSEKFALNHTYPANVYFLAFWENLFLTIITGSYVLKSIPSWRQEIKQNIHNLLTAGVIFTILYFLVLAGFKDGPIALVSTIKKLEVLIVLIISYIFFKEKLGKRIVIASILMLIAVFLIKL